MEAVTNTTCDYCNKENIAATKINIGPITINMCIACLANATKVVFDRLNELKTNND